MNFDSILGILAVIFFVVLPIISSIAESNKKKQGQGSGDQPVKPARPAPEGEDFDLEKAMSEARRRIEALSGEPRASTGTSQPASSSSGGTVMSTTVSGQRVPVGAGQQSIDWQAPPTPRPPRPAPRAPQQPRPPRQPRQGRDSGDSAVSADLQVTRGRVPGPYTERSRSTSGVDLNSRESVLTGLIWHQVLSERPLERRYRRRASRLP